MTDDGYRMTGRTARMVVQAAQDLMGGEQVILVGRTQREARDDLGQRLQNILAGAGCSVTRHGDRIWIENGPDAQCLITNISQIENRVRAMRGRVHVDHASIANLTPEQRIDIEDVDERWQ